MPRKTDAAAVDAARMDRRTWLTGALALLAGCGGVDSGGTGTGDQSTLAVGPITGFGSIIVNAIRFDESAAVIVDDVTTTGATLAACAAALRAAGAKTVYALVLAHAR